MPGEGDDLGILELLNKRSNDGQSGWDHFRRIGLTRSILTNIFSRVNSYNELTKTDKWLRAAARIPANGNQEVGKM